MAEPATETVNAGALRRTPGPTAFRLPGTGSVAAKPRAALRQASYLKRRSVDARPGHGRGVVERASYRSVVAGRRYDWLVSRCLCEIYRILRETVIRSGLSGINSPQRDAKCWIVAENRRAIADK